MNSIKGSLACFALRVVLVSWSDISIPSRGVYEGGRDPVASVGMCDISLGNALYILRQIDLSSELDSVDSERDIVMVVEGL